MADLTPLLAFRWSPRAFDPSAELTPDEAASLLEAARWAPSAGNRQPWRFALGHREDETWKRILVNLPEREQRWARRAAALLLAAHVTATSDRAAADPATGAAADSATSDRAAADTEASAAPGPAAGAPVAPDPQTAYDLGQAVAHLTVQATALGLHVRQIHDLDRAGLAADLDLPGDIRPAVALAVGRLGDPLSLPADLVAAETGLRHRRPLDDLLLV